jgi:hypothetical protein
MTVIRIVPAAGSYSSAQDLLQDSLNSLRHSTFSGNPFGRVWRHAKHGRIKWSWLKDGSAVGRLEAVDEWQLISAIAGFVNRHLAGDISYFAVQYDDGVWPPSNTQTHASQSTAPRKRREAGAGGRGR